MWLRGKILILFHRGIHKTSLFMQIFYLTIKVQSALFFNNIFN